MISVTCEAVCDNCGYRQKVTIGSNRKRNGDRLYGKMAIPDAEEHMITMGWVLDDHGQYCCQRCLEENEGKRE